MKGKDLTGWRLRWGLTQRELARLLGVDVISVSRWERAVQDPTPVLTLALEALEHRFEKGGNDQEPLSMRRARAGTAKKKR